MVASLKLPAIVLLPIALLVSGCAAFDHQSSLDLYLKGQLEIEKGHLPTALANLSEAIKKNPRMGLAYIARGEIYKKQGNYEEAAKDFESAVKLEPYNFSANYQLGIVYQYLK